MNSASIAHSPAWKSPLKNEKGLTLVELLAVVVILGIIAMIAIPSIGGIINNTKKNAHRANAQIIVDAARYMIVSEGFTPAADGVTQSITYTDLLGNGFLEKEIRDPQASSQKYNGATTVTVKTNAKLGFDYTIDLKRTKGASVVSVFKDGQVAEDAISKAIINE
jgi:type IV pilus assembly protein PilA